MTERISVEEYRRLAKEAVAGKTPTKRRGPARKKRSVAKERGDSLATRIARLMREIVLSDRIRLKPEEVLAADFARALRALTASGHLRCVWTHPANEIAGAQNAKAVIRYAIAKLMGLIDGTPDYLFLSGRACGALEAKVGDNDQQANQVDFEAWCRANEVPYATFTSVEDGLRLLRAWGLLHDEGTAWDDAQIG